MKIQKSARKSGLQKLVISASIAAKLIALDEVEVSTRKYLYAKIEMDDGCEAWMAAEKFVCFARRTSKRIRKKEERK